jgi:hypothetical protein
MIDETLSQQDGDPAQIAGPAVVDPCDRSNSYNAKKLDWIAAHRKDAAKVASDLKTTVANILGLSALESGWGQGPFVIGGSNDFFDQWYRPKVPLTTGPIPNHTVQMAGFKSYADSASAFAQLWGYLVQGVSDPSTFAANLQNARVYGIDPGTGAKVPGFVGNVAGTINGLALRLNCEKN